MIENYNNVYVCNWQTLYMRIDVCYNKKIVKI